MPVKPKGSSKSGHQAQETTATATRNALNANGDKVVLKPRFTSARESHQFHYQRICKSIKYPVDLPETNAKIPNAFHNP